MVGLRDGSGCLLATAIAADSAAALFVGASVWWCRATIGSGHFAPQACQVVSVPQEVG